MHDFPSQWWAKAEEKVFNLPKAKEALEKLLSLHSNPQSLIDYLNERRFILLLELLDRSECIKKFLINHPEDFQNTIPGLWYVFKDKKAYLKELKELVHDGMSDEEFSKALAYYRHRELMRIMSKEILGTAKLEDILYEYSQLPDAMLELCYEMAYKEMVESVISQIKLFNAGSGWRTLTCVLVYVYAYAIGYSYYRRGELEV